MIRFRRKKRKRDLGKLGEKEALRHLRRKGYRLIARNYHCRYGEIDLIAIQNDVLVFIEVKARSSDLFGNPETALTSWKIRKIVKTGLYFRSTHLPLPEAMRLDAVLVGFDNQGKIIRTEIIRNLTR